MFLNISRHTMSLLMIRCLVQVKEPVYWDLREPLRFALRPALRVPLRPALRPALRVDLREETLRDAILYYYLRLFLLPSEESFLEKQEIFRMFFGKGVSAGKMPCPFRNEQKFLSPLSSRTA